MAGPASDGGGLQVELLMLLAMAGAAAVSLGLTARFGWWRPRPPEGGPSDDPEAPRLDAFVLLSAGGLAWIATWIGAMLAYQFLLGPSTGDAMGEADRPPLWASSAALLAGLAAQLALLGFLVGVIPVLKRELGLRPTWAAAGRGVAAMLIAYPVVYWVGFVAINAARLLGGAPDPIAHDGLRDFVAEPSAPTRLLTIAAVVIAAPIGEELVFRGFLQTGLARLAGGPWRGILGASLVFTLVHAGVADAASMPVLFALSIAMGVVYERTRSLTAPIVLHALFNAGNLLLASIAPGY